MKKVTLLLGAIVLGFMLTSCENKKDQVIKEINAYYDNELVELNKVENLETLMEFVKASDERADAFNLVWFPQDETKDPLKNLTDEELESVYDVIDERGNELDDAFYAKASEYYEPIISELESTYAEFVALAEQYENIDDVPEEIFNPLFDKLSENYNNAIDYRSIADSDQFDRLYEFISVIEEEEDAQDYWNEYYLHF